MDATTRSGESISVNSFIESFGIRIGYEPEDPVPARDLGTEAFSSGWQLGIEDTVFALFVPDDARAILRLMFGSSFVAGPPDPPEGKNRMRTSMPLKLALRILSDTDQL